MPQTRYGVGTGVQSIIAGYQLRRILSYILDRKNISFEIHTNSSYSYFSPLRRAFELNLTIRRVAHMPRKIPASQT